MRVLQRTDYENLAKEAVDQMIGSSIPLADSLVKISDSMGLTPDQIQALVQVANTLAHLDLFDRKAEDKIVEFDPADPSDVVKRVVSSGPTAVEVPLVSSEEKTTDFFGDLPKSESPCGAASGASTDGTQIVKEVMDNITPHRQQMMIIKIRKVAEELNMRKMSAAIEYEEVLDKLASDFASLYGPDFGEFEKDAIDIYGGDAVPVLADMRSLLRLPEIKVAVYEKTARLVDTDNKEMKTFKKLCSLVEESKACAAGLQLIQDEAGEVL